MFAAAAPTMALVTYFGLSQVIIDIHIYLLTLYNSTWLKLNQLLPSILGKKEGEIIIIKK